MTRRPARLLLLAASALLGACGGSGPGAPAPQASLGYRIPTPPALEYVVGDTARVDLQAGGQAFPLSLQAMSRWKMEFTDGGNGRIRVTSTLADLVARISNPMIADQTADESAVTGPTVFTIDEAGDAELETIPELTGPAAGQFVSGPGLAHSFFPALPARAVRPGDSWADTLDYEDETGGAETNIHSIMNYTAVGDTVVGGATYLLVRNTGTSEQSTSGELMGTDFSQSVGGTTAGYFLWDMRQGALHSLEYRSDLEGTMALSIVPAPMTVSVKGHIHVERVMGTPATAPGAPPPR
jgi:hypothetical protein